MMMMMLILVWTIIIVHTYFKHTISMVACFLTEASSEYMQPNTKREAASTHRCVVL